MIPAGYITLPEAVDIIERCIDEDDHFYVQLLLMDPPTRKQAAAALALPVYARDHDIDHTIPLYVMRGGKLFQIMIDEIEGLVSEAGLSWIREGRPCLEDAIAKKRSDEQCFEATEKYDGCLFLVEETVIRSHWPHPDRPEPLQRMGPGRPSSMPLVLEEFERRRSEGLCEHSRSAEGKALAAWLKRTHPDAPPADAKTITKNLPSDFQPHDDCAKKSYRAPKEQFRARFIGTFLGRSA